MKIPFFRHFNPITQLFAAYTLYFLGLLVTLGLIRIIVQTIWHIDTGKPEMLIGNPEYMADIQRLFALIGGFLVFMAPATIFRRYMEFEGQDYLRVRHAPSAKKTGLVILLLLVCIIVSNYLFYLNTLLNPDAFSAGFGQYIKQAEKEEMDLQVKLLTEPNIWMYLLNLLSVAVLAAVGEELFYRGIVQRLFVKMLRNPHVAVIITALIFSLMHFSYYGFLSRFFMGIVLGYIYLCTGNLWYGILFHFFNNAYTITCYWLMGKGINTTTALYFGAMGADRWIGLALLVILTVFALTQMKKLIDRPLMHEMTEY